VLKFERSMRNGIAGRVNYTWSRNWDNLFGQSNFLDATVATPVDNYNLDAEYSPSVATAPHRAVATGTYQLPFGRGRRFLSSRSVAETILGGWQVTAIGTYQSGFPLSISQNNNNAGTFGGGQRPNLVEGVDLGTSGSNLDRIGGWLNPAAFAAAAPFTVGNAPRTLDLLGPSIKNWDFAVDKSVSVGGHASGMIRFELINAFNITGLTGSAVAVSFLILAIKVGLLFINLPEWGKLIRSFVLCWRHHEDPPDISGCCSSLVCRLWSRQTGFHRDVGSDFE